MSWGLVTGLFGIWSLPDQHQSGYHYGVLVAHTQDTHDENGGQQLAGEAKDGGLQAGLLLQLCLKLAALRQEQVDLAVNRGYCLSEVGHRRCGGRAGDEDFLTGHRPGLQSRGRVEPLEGHFPPSRRRGETSLGARDGGHLGQKIGMMSQIGVGSG